MWRKLEETIYRGVYRAIERQKERQELNESIQQMFKRDIPIHYTSEMPAVTLAHGEYSGHRCGWCGRQFPTERGLNIHRTMTHRKK